MIKDIVKDEKELSTPCEKFKKEDIREIEKITKDLIDTATYYAENDKNGCVGLAANQIGYNRRIIIVNKQDGDWEVFVIFSYLKGLSNKEHSLLNLNLLYDFLL